MQFLILGESCTDIYYWGFIKFRGHKISWFHYKQPFQGHLNSWIWILKGNKVQVMVIRGHLISWFSSTSKSTKLNAQRTLMKPKYIGFNLAFCKICRDNNNFIFDKNKIPLFLFRRIFGNGKHIFVIKGIFNIRTQNKSYCTRVVTVGTWH